MSLVQISAQVRPLKTSCSGQCLETSMVSSFFSPLVKWAKSAELLAMYLLIPSNPVTCSDWT